jgi:hypothetical protein
MRVAVVGHTEWVWFGTVDRIPAAGEIAHSSDDWEEPGGGGAVAAVQLAKLGGSCDFLTALGTDGLGDRAARELAALGVDVHAARRDDPTRRALTLVDPAGERTITTLGRRLAPSSDDCRRIGRGRRRVRDGGRYRLPAGTQGPCHGRDLRVPTSCSTPTSCPTRSWAVTATLRARGRRGAAVAAAAPRSGGGDVGQPLRAASRPGATRRSRCHATRRRRL